MNNLEYTNINKQEIKLVKSLKSANGRKKSKSFIVEGIKNVSELFDSKYEIQQLFLSEKLPESKLDYFRNLCWQRNIPFKMLYSHDYDKLTTLVNPEGIMGLSFVPEEKILDNTNIEFPAVFLSQINNPGNLGTVCRTVAWYGIKTLLLSEDSVDACNPKVIRSSMGGFFNINIIQNINEKAFLKFIKSNKISLYTTGLDGQNPVTFFPNSKYIICFGSESHGLSLKMLENSNKVFHIPKYGNGESLNLAVSVGIILNSIINKG